MKRSDKGLITFSLMLFVISTYAFHYSLPSAYSQSSTISEDSSLQYDFLTYYDPFTMIKIQYPSFWEAVEIPNSKIVSFISPLETTGVIIHSMPTPGESADEVLMNMLIKIKNNLPNVTITNTNISQASDGSTIQTLIFTYEDDSNPNVYKVFQLLKTHKDVTYVFTYHSSEVLFDRFFPLVSQMYNSYQVPSFDNVFPANVYSGDPLFSYQTTSQFMKDQEHFLTYNNETLGFEIQYPSNAKKIEQERGVEFLFPDNRSAVILATSDVDSTSNTSYAKTHFIYLNQSLDNFHVLNTSRSDVMGYPTAKILFTYSNGTELYKGMQLWTVEENIARLFTYFAPSNDIFDEWLSTIDRMLKTLKVP